MFQNLCLIIASPVHHASEAKYNGEPTTSLDRDFQKRKKEVRYKLPFYAMLLSHHLLTCKLYQLYVKPGT